jgi:hypothetical protein
MKSAVSMALFYLRFLFFFFLLELSLLILLTR